MSKTELDQEQWLGRWAERVHRSGLAVIVLPLLEVGRGLGFLVGQALLLAQPVLAGLVDEASIDQYVTLLENPDAMERLIERIERKTESDG